MALNDSEVKCNQRVVRVCLGCGMNLYKKDLTKREIEVLRLVALGNSVKEIATALNLSVKTIEVHKYNLMQKLDLHKTAHVVMYAVAHGIITVKPLESADAR